MLYEIRSLDLVTCICGWATFTLNYSNPEAVFNFCTYEFWCCMPLYPTWNLKLLSSNDEIVIGLEYVNPLLEKDFHASCLDCLLSSPLLFAWRLTPRDVARSWHKNSVEGILSKQPEGRIRILPSPYLCLPLMSIVKIARWVQYQTKYVVIYISSWSVHD